MATITTTTATAARDIRGLIWSYIRLTKPRIVMLLVITTIPAMMLAEGGVPSAWLMLATVFGGSVVAGGANALNMYFDRDIDQIMVRTRVRPVPSGQVDPEKAAIFGIVLGGAGFAFMQVFVNPLAAFLTIGALAFYVVVYTLILKRSTPLNIVIGGAAGAMPPVIGWAAVTNSVSVEALLMFAIVTLWTPPHFWALSSITAATTSAPASRCSPSSAASTRRSARYSCTHSPSSADDCAGLLSDAPSSTWRPPPC